MATNVESRMHLSRDIFTIDFLFIDIIPSTMKTYFLCLKKYKNPARKEIFALSNGKKISMRIGFREFY